MQTTIRNTDDDLSTLRQRELIYRREESAFAGTREYTFKHAVLRDVTYESVLKRLRKVYHGLVADWLIEHSADRPAEFAGLIAEHLLLAGKSEQAEIYLRTAGEAALASYANPEAESYFRRVLDLSPSEEERALLLSGLGEALSRQGFSDEALQTWREAIELFQTLGDDDHMADLYARSSWIVWQMGDQTKCEQLCQEALALLVDAPDSQGKARLLAESGRIAHFATGEIEAESEPLCQAALEMAERLELLEVQAEARITLALRFLRYADHDLKEGMNNLKKVVEFAETNGLLRTASRAHGNLAWFKGFTGDIISAHQHFLQSVEITKQIGDVQLELFSLGNLAGSYLDLGELQAVEDILQTIEEIHTTTPESQSQYRLGSIRTLLLLFRGEWKMAMEMNITRYEDVREGGDGQRLAQWNLNFADTILELNRFGIFGNYELAESALSENLEIETKVIPSLSRKIIACARQRQFEKAYDWLAKVKKHQYFLEFNSFEMLKLRTDVELAFADGRWGEAVTACQSLIEICQCTGYRWEWARRLIDLAEALMQRDEPGDQEQARQHLQQSLDKFTEMGASGYVNVVQERLRALRSLEE